MGVNECLGDVLKVGVFVVFDNRVIIEILFIDELLLVEEIVFKLSEFKVDFVIGLLFKSNIEKLNIV